MGAALPKVRLNELRDLKAPEARRDAGVRITPAVKNESIAYQAAPEYFQVPPHLEIYSQRAGCGSEMDLDLLNPFQRV